MDFILSLNNFPPGITTVNSTVLWRGSQRDICTTFFQTFLKQYLPDIIKRGGLSTALCFAIFRSYPEASVSNFRQLTNSQLIFTVEQDGRFTEDVRNRIAQLNLKEFFNSLSALYEDRYFNIYKNLPVEFCRHIVHKEKAANDDGILQSSISSTERDKMPDKSDYETSTTEQATLNFDDFKDFFAAEDNELLWKQKKYKDAVPGLEKELKTASSFDRSIVQIKLALCLKESGQTDASNQMLGEALNSLEKSPPPAPLCFKYAESLCDIVQHYIGLKSFVRAVLILKLSVQLFVKSTQCDNALSGIANCMIDLNVMLKSTDYGHITDTVQQALHKFCNSIIDITHGDPNVKARMQAQAQRHLGQFYSKQVQPENAIRHFKSCLDIMEMQFGNMACKYSDYAISTHNIAACFDHMHKTKDARHFAEKTLERIQLATDWNDESKKKSLSKTNTLLTKLNKIATH